MSSRHSSLMSLKLTKIKTDEKRNTHSYKNITLRQKISNVNTEKKPSAKVIFLTLHPGGLKIDKVEVEKYETHFLIAQIVLF